MFDIISKFPNSVRQLAYHKKHISHHVNRLCSKTALFYSRCNIFRAIELYMRQRISLEKLCNSLCSLSSIAIPQICITRAIYDVMKYIYQTTFMPCMVFYGGYWSRFNDKKYTSMKLCRTIASDILK